MNNPRYYITGERLRQVGACDMMVAQFRRIFGVNDQGRVFLTVDNVRKLLEDDSMRGYVTWTAEQLYHLTPSGSQEERASIEICHAMWRELRKRRPDAVKIHRQMERASEVWEARRARMGDLGSRSFG